MTRNIKNLRSRDIFFLSQYKVSAFMIPPGLPIESADNKLDLEILKYQEKKEQLVLFILTIIIVVTMIT